MSYEKPPDVRSRLLKKIIQEGLQIAPEALDFLVSLNSPEEILQDIYYRVPKEEIPIVINKTFLKTWMPTTLQLDITKDDSTQEHIELVNIVTTLDLENRRIASIDPSPLSSCSNLSILNLSENCLESIDLTSLRFYENLKEINLSQNSLSKIDLFPLRDNRSLSELNLQGNNFETIDSTPLHNKQLQSFDINKDAKLVTILEDTRFSKSYPRAIYDAPVQLPNLKVIPYLFSLVKGKAWKPIHLLHEALRLLDLDWLGMIDTDVEPLLQDVISKNIETDEIETVRMKALEVLIPLVIKQIDEGRTTFGLDIERAVTESKEIAKRVERINEIRNDELRQVKVVRHSYDTRAGGDVSYDMRALLLTHYGNQIIKSLEITGWKIDDQEQELNQALEELGHELQIVSVTYRETEWGEWEIWRVEPIICFIWRVEICR
ncbi:MAG: hypothetical protein ACTSSE_19085 [Candidatus Thorarchaeota archaeon]